MRRTWFVAPLAATAVLLLTLGAARSQQPRSTSDGGFRLKRIERVYRYPDRWVSECDFDYCGIAILFSLPVTTPRAAEKVDVVMTATLDYRTSPGDYGVASAGFSTSREGGEKVALRPRRWPLAPVSRSTTTTLTWVKKGVRAEGRRYFFSMSVPSREGTDPQADQNRISGSKVAVVVELTPAN